MYQFSGSGCGTALQSRHELRKYSAPEQSTAPAALEGRLWPVAPFRSTRIIGFRITALPYIAEQGLTELLINPFDPLWNLA